MKVGRCTPQNLKFLICNLIVILPIMGIYHFLASNPTLVSWHQNKLKMKKTLLFSVALILGFLNVQSQTVEDSIQTGPAYANDVFYSFKTGMVKASPNSEWQMAFSIGVFNVAVRTNAAASSSGLGSVIAYEMPGTDTSEWSIFDTTGFKAWKVLENSDEDWEMGALNSSSSGTDDYGWGMYDANSHNVVGHRLYLLAINNGAGTTYKKVFVMSKSLGAWVVKAANIDGSNESNFTLGQSGAYSTKNFVYLNLLSNTVVDREPNKTDWDFVLTRYRAYQAGAGIYYPSTGILTNAGVKVAEARGIPVADAMLSNYIADTSDNISTIGADWKVLAGMSFNIADSLCYFVKAKDGAFWKLKFTKFAGSSTGNTVFNKTRLTPATSLDYVASSKVEMALYPNPASNLVSVLFDANGEASQINVLNLNGQLVLQNNEINSSSILHNINVSGLNQGVYVVEVKTSKGSATQKLVIN
jgi:hypothetical protein